MSTRRRLLSLLLCVVIAAPVTLSAQIAITAQRQRLDISAAELRGDALVFKENVGGAGVVERVHPLSSIIAVEWPLPDELVAAEAALQRGDSAAALGLFVRQVALHAPYRRAAGSHWVRAYHGLAGAQAAEGLLAEAQKVRDELAALRIAPQLLTSLDVALALGRAQKGDPEAQAALAKLRETTTDELERARLWLAEAAALRRRGRVEEALLAYLQVTVFHPRANEAQPDALLGAARCYLALGEQNLAGQSLDLLAAEYPDSAAAKVAAAEALN